MLKAEGRKFERTSHAFLFLLFFLLAHTCYSFDFPLSFVNGQDIWMEDYRSRLEGKLTADKEAFIMQENRRLSDLAEEYERLSSLVFNGEISSEEYSNRMSRQDELKDQQHSFARVWNQYLYVREDPAQHYFLFFDLQYYFQGFWPFVFLLIFLLPRYILQDYITGMGRILSVQLDSLRNLAFKANFWLFFYACILVLSWHIPVCFRLLSSGNLHLLSYPLNSLASFFTLTSTLTIGEALFRLLLLRFAAILCFTAFLFFLTLFLKSISLTVLCCSIACLLDLSFVSRDVSPSAFPSLLNLLQGAPFFDAFVPILALLCVLFLVFLFLANRLWMRLYQKGDSE